jgi:predicted ATPase/Tfp pilus assembly protein PilF
MRLVGGLPAVASRFIGREDDLAALAELFATERLVTLLGPPGVGKTRLAVEFAAAHGPAFVAVVFCDLTEATELEAVRAAVARALDAPIAAAQRGESALIAAIAARGRTLLLLDNFEQVADHAAATVGAWLASAPEARFLVTSRRRLGLAGEALFDLGPLALPDPGGDPAASPAVELFLDRARAVRRDHVPDPEEVEVIGRLVRELDGLPLAIELCAARMRLLTPARLADKLPMRFDLLVGSATPGNKPVGLREAIASSWEPLTPAERSALVQCTVFRGGFNDQAAEAVLDLSAHPEAPWPLDVLQSLVDKSLVHVGRPARSGGTRRLSLYVSIREFAAEQPAHAAERAGAMARHAAWFLELGARAAHDAEGAGAVQARLVLAEEAENLLAVHRRARRGVVHGAGRLGAPQALDAALALMPLLSARGPLAMALQLVDEALDESALDAPRLARALSARGRMLRRLGRAPEAVESCARARTAAEGAGDPQLSATVSIDLAGALLSSGQWTEARAAHEHALSDARRVEAWREVGLALSGIGDTYVFEDDLERARANYGRARDVLRQADNLAAEGLALARLALVDMERGRTDLALEEYRAALRIHREVDDRAEACATAGYMAILLQELGRFGEARTSFEAALAEARELGDLRREGIVSCYLGACLLEMGLVEDARSRLEQAARTLDQAGVDSAAALCRGCLGSLMAAHGDVDAARVLFGAAEAALATRPEQSFIGAAVKIHRGHLDLALARVAAEPSVAARHRADARRRLVEAPENGQTDVRYALRRLGAAMDAEMPVPEGEHTGDTHPRSALVVAQGAKWFRPPHGQAVDIDRRKPLRLLLEALLRARLDHPGQPVPAKALVDAAWHGEILRHDAAANRLRVALSTLRKVGLGTVLLTRAGGYLLDPSIEVAVE